MVAVSVAHPTTSRGAAPVLISMVAAASVYTCVPDTERALIVLGAIVGSGLCALRFHWPWGAATAVSTVALAWVAVVDGSARSSAVVGALGVVAIHQLLQMAMRDDRVSARSALVLLGIGVATCAASARLAGVGSGIARPVLEAAAAVTLTAAAAWLLRARGKRGPTGVSGSAHR